MNKVEWLLMELKHFDITVLSVGVAVIVVLLVLVIVLVIQVFNIRQDIMNLKSLTDQLERGIRAANNKSINKDNWPRKY